MRLHQTARRKSRTLTALVALSRQLLPCGVLPNEVS